MPSNIGEQPRTVDLIMEIDITKIQSYIISLKTANERREKMAKLMSSLNIDSWSFFDAIDVSKHFPYWIGCGLSHREILARAKYPCIIYEDDILPTNWYRNVIKLPKDAICYLGISRWGTKEGFSNVNGVEFQKTDIDDVLQVKHMVSAHAVYYPNKESADTFSNGIIRQLFETLKPMDEWFAKAQTEMTVYSLRQPIFYQNCDKNNMWTYFEVDKNDILL